MLKKIVLAEAFILSILLSCLFCYLIAETFFFGIFFEQKSLMHGYWREGEVLDEASFGERGKDIIYLRNLAMANSSEEDSHEEAFKIAIFGDSYAWGNGNRLNNIFPLILEKELSETLSGESRVYNFSMGGDSLLDHAAKLEILERNKKEMDLYVILLVINDLMLRPSDDFYKSGVYESIINYCESLSPNEQTIRHPAWDLPLEEKNLLVIKNHHASFESQVNKCIFKESLKSIKAMTNNQVIFLVSDYHKEKGSQWNMIMDFLSEENVNYIDSQSGVNLKKYAYCWVDEEHLRKCFWITPKDGHPSAILHNLYADLIKNVVINLHLK